MVAGADTTTTAQEVGDTADHSGFGTAAEAVAQIKKLERERRLIEARQIGLLGELEASFVLAEHGHASAKTMMAHNAKLSGPEAAARSKVQKMMKRCHQIAAVFNAGDLGVDQARLLGRVFANRRIRARFIDQQGWFLAMDRRHNYRDFADVVAAWVEIADHDGVDPADAAHQRRDATMTENSLANTWETKAVQAPNAGAIEKEIFDAYVEAEFHKDWDAAKAIHGNNVCTDLLARTDAQRRADAHHQIYLDAAANKAVSAAAHITHNVVWSEQAYNEMVSRFAGKPANPLDPETHRCSTIDGYRLNPAEAFLDSLNQTIRRAVINAASVTIDLGHARLFTGLARLAAQISRNECGWIGCHVPASRCQIDHINPHRNGGPTNQTNALPFCRRHNRHKEKGYTVWRDPNGKIHITTPAGATIT